MIETALVSAAFDSLAKSIGTEAGKSLISKLKKQPDVVGQAVHSSIGSAIDALKKEGGASVRKLAEVLEEKEGPLSHHAIVQELLKPLISNHSINSELIAKEWCDYARFETHRVEVDGYAKRFSELYTNQLYLRPELSPLIANRQVIAGRETPSSASENELRLAAYLDGTKQNDGYETKRLLEDQWIDELTQRFVGRAFLFSAVDRFVEESDSGYLLIQGDPGIGKSAFAAQLCKSRSYLRHFNGKGASTGRAIVESFSKQLAKLRDRKEFALPIRPDDFQDYLYETLREASNGATQPMVFVVDALDEVRLEGACTAEAALHLPDVLPRGVYGVVTGRRGDHGKTLRRPLEDVEIRHDSVENLEDVRAYVRQRSNSEAILYHLASCGATQDQLVETVTENSEGNFMFVVYVLDALERGELPGGLTKLPRGLEQFYEKQWERLNLNSSEPASSQRRRILATLCLYQPLSIGALNEYSGTDDIEATRSALRSLIGLLHRSETDLFGKSRPSYRIYHESFRDFLFHRKDLADFEGAINERVTELQLAAIERS